MIKPKDSESHKATANEENFVVACAVISFVI